MLTPRGWGLLFTAAAAWVLSRMFGVPEVAIAAVAILALVGLAVLVTRFGSATLTLDRRIVPSRIHHDERAGVEIRLKNRGRLPTTVLQLDDQAPRQLAPGSRFLVEPLASGEMIRLRYALDGRQRGRYLVGPARIALRDPFGIAQRFQALGRTDEVVVYPEIVALPIGPTLAGHLGIGADGRARPGPTGDEVANVREYVRGDDLRKVHWRSTAHRGKLMVRQDENRQRPQATIVLDPRPEAHSTGRGSSFEAAVSAAASITFHLNDRGFRVILVDGPVTAPPRPLPWELTLEHLAVVQPQPVDLRSLWRQLERGVAGDGSLIMILPTPTPDELRELVRAGRSFGARVALVVDAAAFGRHGRHRSTADAAAALRAAGWYVAVVRPGEPLDRLWRELKAQRIGYLAGRRAG